MISNANATSGGRFDEEGDWITRQFFSPADLQLQPEEYVAGGPDNLVVRAAKPQEIPEKAVRTIGRHS